MDEEHIEIRKPAAAGLFYPENAGELGKVIAGFYSEVDRPTLEGPPLGLIVPHAGYPYSGKTAARAFKALVGEQYETVIIISPSHTVFFKGSSVYNGNGYQTPLGVVEIDSELSEKISEIHPSVYLSAQGHASGATRGEHALEVQLPFLQVALGNFKLVAIVMGDQEEESINALTETLFAALNGSKKNVLMVASSDLSHFHSEKKANRLDSTIRDAVEKYDPKQLLQVLESGKGEACGGGPMAAVMESTRRLGGGRARVLEYTTSGASTGEFDEVVGYLSAVIIAGEKVKREKSARKLLGQHASRKKEREGFNEEESKLLREMATEAIKAHFDKREYKPPHRDKFQISRGAFVTINVDGELRGCIGQVKGRYPLDETIPSMAVAAAFEDPRFEPLTREEFENIEIEISVLSTLERIRKFDKIVIGSDGIYIKLDMHSGLLLPQVAVEHGWDVTELLEQTSLKAGLAKNAYLDRFAEVYRFTAEVI